MSEGDLGGFGDERLRRVGARLLAAMQETPSMCLHTLAEDRKETIRFGRFLANATVSADEMLVHAGQLTGKRAHARHVLAIQDTSELRFDTHTQSKRGFGRTGNGGDIGLFLHPTLALDAQSGGVLGLVGAQVINRTGAPAGEHHARSADAKESRRWLAAAETAAAALETAASVTVVGDRESDIYDLFARRPPTVHLLCRAAQNRRLEDGSRLFDQAQTWPEQACYTIEVRPRGSTPARQAQLCLRFGQVTLQRPPGASRTLPNTVTVRVVEVVERDPPTPQAAIRWCLLTTHDVPDAAQALQMVRWYQARWTIEQVFRTIKSAGAQVEASQLTEAASLVKLAVAALIAAVRIMQIVIARDGTTEQPLADAADPADTPMLQAFNAKLEGRTAQLKNPHRTTTLAWFAWIVGRLGGWSGYTSRGYKPPGPKTIARGLAKLDAMTEGWLLAHSAHV